MSIRIKLLVSYIAMIIIPVILFGLASALLFSAFFKLSAEPDTLAPGGEAGRFPAFRSLMEERNEWATGLALIARIDPGRLQDDAFLREADEQLTRLQAGMAIEKNGRLIHVSPAFDQADLADRLQQLDTRNQAMGHAGRLVVGDSRYFVEKRTVAFADGSPGALYVFSDERPVTGFFRTFFPMLLLTLLAAIALTNGLLTYLLSRSIVRPLQALERAADHIGQGDLEHELKLGRKDEIGRLSEAFEEMRLRLKESLRVQLQYEENRKELISSISHDLKTPIAAIAGCVEGLKDGIADTPDKQHHYLNMIHKKTADMDRLIDELFLFSKLDLNRVPFDFEPVDIRAMLRDVAEELRLHPQYRGIRIVFDDGQGPPVFVSADREKLGRVIANITDNSLKAMAERDDREIRLRLTDGRDAATVSIADNGPGIASEALPRIFERFYRADPSRNTNQGGSGLGLAIVKQIVAAHGGSVWAESAHGQGTTIRFTLNKTDQPAGESHEKNIDH